MYFCFPRTTRKPKYFLPGLCAFTPRFQRPLVHRQQRRASEKHKGVRARDGGALLVAENVFFESFIPLAVLCSTV
jgi:hypothetical protein